MTAVPPVSNARSVPFAKLFQPLKGNDSRAACDIYYAVQEHLLFQPLKGNDSRAAKLARS